MAALPVPAGESRPAPVGPPRPRASLRNGGAPLRIAPGAPRSPRGRNGGRPAPRDLTLPRSPRPDPAGEFCEFCKSLKRASCNPEKRVAIGALRNAPALSGAAAGRFQATQGAAFRGRIRSGRLPPGRLVSLPRNTQPVVRNKRKRRNKVTTHGLFSLLSLISQPPGHRRASPGPSHPLL